MGRDGRGDETEKEVLSAHTRAKSLAHAITRERLPRRAVPWLRGSQRRDLPLPGRCRARVSRPVVRWMRMVRPTCHATCARRTFTMTMTRDVHACGAPAGTAMHVRKIYSKWKGTTWRYARTVKTESVHPISRRALFRPGAALPTAEEEGRSSTWLRSSGCAACIANEFILSITNLRVNRSSSSIG
jgi:hypothetical protein